MGYLTQQILLCVLAAYILGLIIGIGALKLFWPDRER